MRKKYCISIDESIMMMLEELTDIIIPFTKLSKSSATEYCIRSTYQAIRKADEICREKEQTKQLTNDTSKTQLTKSKL